MRITSILLAAAATLFTLPALADDMTDLGPWQVRIRVLGVLPDASAKVSPIGGSVNITNSIVPEGRFHLFPHRPMSLELIAATTKHGVSHTPSGLDLGSAWLLPPTLTAQYHFDQIGPFRSYVGAGVNYTFFYSIHAPTALAPIHYDDTFGWALQAGADMPIGEQGYFLNVDVKKLFLNTSVGIAQQRGSRQRRYQSVDRGSGCGLSLLSA